jgi:hypothetical protein
MCCSFLRAGVFVLAVLAAPGPGAQDREVERLKRSARATCELAGLVVASPGGWFSVPFDTPPPGHAGCQMMLYNEQNQLLGVMRIRSASDPASEFAADGYDRLLANEITAMSAMDILFDQERGPLWTRDNMPVAGEGFREGRAVGLAARIKGNDVAQEAHFVVFRSDAAKYLISLLTPTQAYDKRLYQRNTSAMGTLMRTLQPSGSR